ncbi:hypothetical protein AAG570_001561 [Ranatra chinensis]|uniref:Uncharacterized protein n=1 Tax=Ranatra chinensis TaxID=642074 RepID=A0ABD0YVF4_9HEMI
MASKRRFPILLASAPQGLSGIDSSCAPKMEIQRRHTATPPQIRDGNVDAHSTQAKGGTGSNHTAGPKILQQLSNKSRKSPVSYEKYETTYVQFGILLKGSGSKRRRAEERPLVRHTSFHAGCVALGNASMEVSATASMMLGGAGGSVPLDFRVRSRGGPSRSPTAHRRQSSSSPVEHHQRHHRRESASAFTVVTPKHEDDVGITCDVCIVMYRNTEYQKGLGTFSEDLNSQPEQLGRFYVQSFQSSVRVPSNSFLHVQPGVVGGMNGADMYYKPKETRDYGFLVQFYSTARVALLCGPPKMAAGGLYLGSRQFFRSSWDFSPILNNYAKLNQDILQ